MKKIHSNTTGTPNGDAGKSPGESSQGEITTQEEQLRASLDAARKRVKPLARRQLEPEQSSQEVLHFRLKNG